VGDEAVLELGVRNEEIGMITGFFEKRFYAGEQTYGTL
jgi:hypothetical protein